MGIAVDEDGDGGSDGHCQVVRQPVVADAFRTTRRRQYIYSHCGIGYRQRTKGPSVKCSHNGEQQQRGCCQITNKEQREESETDHQYHLARKGVDHESAERTKHQCRDGIAGENQSDNILGGTEMLAQIERQQGCQLVEGKEQCEVGCHHLAIVPIP